MKGPSHLVYPLKTFPQGTGSGNEDEDSDSDFGDWDQDNWGNSSEMKTPTKSVKLSATSSGVRNNASYLHSQRVRFLKNDIKFVNTMCNI